ncbi:response regulator transcription factor [uncultured Helicobacter sp.]|uniref:response regulator transcription factor n=1 Tax=uncultured Helicobacter sp. TaxID=175537 RepID=UPI00374F045F
MVYVLEDDESILELVLYALRSQSIEAQGFSNAKTFFESCKIQSPSLVVLDVMLPGMSGFEVLQQLKNSSKTRHIPILLLTALSSEYDKVKGLDLGADDYLTKPFGVMELLARIRAMLRRIERNEEDIYFEGLEFSFTKHHVVLEGKTLDLTLKEFELLGILLKNKERSFSREEILEIVWGQHYTAQTRTLDVHIKTLRQKLGQWGKRIKTIRGVGYKLGKE